MVHPVPGIRLSAASAGIYDPPRPDVALIECVEGSTVAAVFTKNCFSAAPVQLSKLHLAD
ncbi:MAG: bifunctional ornithine acetyltransferase/N-acetylglutamate synthase, partial [Gammaproteobacteria bacterium]